MAVKFFDNFFTTLTADYASGATSLVVSSLPSGVVSGDEFYLEVYDGTNTTTREATREVMKVTAFTGSGPYTLTVSGAKANTTARNHYTGETVGIGESCKDFWNSFRSQLHNRSTDASKAVTAAGNTHWASDGNLIYVDDGSVLNPYGPIFPGKRLNSADWTALNSPTLDWTAGGLLISQAASSDQVRGVLQASISAPFEVVISFSPLTFAEQFHSAGIVFADSSSPAKLLCFGWGCSVAGANRWHIDRWTNPSSFASNPVNFLLNILTFAPAIRVRVRESTSSRTLAINSGMSESGWEDIGSLTNTDHFSTTQVGVYIHTNNGSRGTKCYFNSIDVRSYTP